MNKMKDDPEYQAAYEQMLKYHLRTSEHDRRRRLEQGHGHAEQKFLEKVWWPAFGHFEGLYPEYAVRDFKDGQRYIDYAYFTAGLKIAIEIDGFGPHWQDITRHQFIDSRVRQNHLVIDGWHVIRFAYDDIMANPRRCQQTLQQLLGSIGNVCNSSALKLRPIEQMILNVAMKSSEPLKPVTVATELGIHPKTALKHFHSLINKGYLISVKPSAKRIRQYTIRATIFGIIRPK